MGRLLTMDKEKLHPSLVRNCEVLGFSSVQLQYIGGEQVQAAAEPAANPGEGASAPAPEQPAAEAPPPAPEDAPAAVTQEGGEQAPPPAAPEDAPPPAAEAA